MDLTLIHRCGAQRTKKEQHPQNQIGTQLCQIAQTRARVSLCVVWCRAVCAFTVVATPPVSLFLTPPCTLSLAMVSVGMHSFGPPESLIVSLFQIKNLTLRCSQVPAKEGVFFGGGG